MQILVILFFFTFSTRDICHWLWSFPTTKRCSKILKYFTKKIKTPNLDYKIINLSHIISLITKLFVDCKEQVNKLNKCILQMNQIYRGNFYPSAYCRKSIIYQKKCAVYVKTVALGLRHLLFILEGLLNLFCTYLLYFLDSFLSKRSFFHFDRSCDI